MICLSVNSRYSSVTITRVGTNQKYANGWDAAFGTKKNAGKKSSGAKKVTATKKKKAATTKKSPKRKSK